MILNRVVDPRYIAAAAALGNYDAYVKLTVRWDGREQTWMARDWPHTGRRFTVLDTGTEFFATPEGLESIKYEGHEVLP